MLHRVRRTVFRRNFGSFCKKHFYVLATYHNVLITR
jgi:hypothetical protein